MNDKAKIKKERLEFVLRDAQGNIKEKRYCVYKNNKLVEEGVL